MWEDVGDGPIKIGPDPEYDDGSNQGESPAPKKPDPRMQELIEITSRRLSERFGEILDAQMFNSKWDLRFISLAREVAQWSKDPSTKCGAVIVRPDRTVASVGFNGFPKGCDDAPEIYADRDLKLSRVVHAEQNAILHAREPLHGYEIFTWPPGISGSCDRCTAHIIQSGITRICHLFDSSSDFSVRWREAAARANQMYGEVGVTVTQYPVEVYESYWDND